MRLLCAVMILAGSLAIAEDLYVFTRPGCSPCDDLKAALKRDPSLIAGHQLYMIDTKAHPEIAARYGIKAVPVLILFRDGKEISRRIGFASEQELRDWLAMKLKRAKK